MTTAPDDLLEVQRYAHAVTGQPWDALGIIHGTPQGGGYHEGEDLLIQAGRAPGTQYPYSDYSYTDSPRDLLPTGRLAGGDDASAFDFGNGFAGFLQFNAWMRQRMLAGDPRTHDIREMIHTLDGQTVRRIDRTGRQPDSGDNSHLSHTHFSFFRDSLGRRNRDDNFLGLLKEFFGGSTPSTGDDLMGVLISGEPIEQYLPRIERSLLWPVPGIAKDVQTLKVAAAATATATAGLRAAVDALAAAINKGGGNIDVAAITAAIDAKTSEVKQLVEQRHAEEMAALKADRAAEVAALQAQLAALGNG